MDLSTTRIIGNPIATTFCVTRHLLADACTRWQCIPKIVYRPVTVTTSGRLLPCIEVSLSFSGFLTRYKFSFFAMMVYQQRLQHAADFMTEW